MNMYVMIIAAFLVVLMVMFGRNPVEEARKAREAQGSSDPLIHATDEYFSQKHHYYGFTKTDNDNTQSFSPPSAYPSLPSAYPSYINGQNNDYPSQANPQNLQNGYYPPPPPGMPPSPLQKQQQAQWPQQE